MPYGLQIGIRLCPDGRSARSDRTAIGLDPARLEAQYAAGRDRFGQNFHGGQRHQPAQPADPRIESQQDTRGTALRGVQELFPENAVEYFVSYYDYYQPEAYLPSTDTYIEKDLSINDEIEKMRLSTTATLLSGRRDVIVVSSVSCLYGCGNPSDFHSMAIHIEVGEILNYKQFLYKLVEASIPGPNGN